MGYEVSQWFEFRKTQTIRAKRILGPADLESAFLPEDGVQSWDLTHGFRVRTREGNLGDIPWGYWVATDGKSYWPIAPDFMEANYERV